MRPEETGVAAQDQVRKDSQVVGLDLKKLDIAIEKTVRFYHIICFHRFLKALVLDGKPDLRGDEISEEDGGATNLHIRFFSFFSPANIIDCAKYCYVFNHVLLYVVDGASEDIEDCLGMADQVLFQVDKKLQFS